MKKLYKKNSAKMRFIFFVLIFTVICGGCKKEWLEAKTNKKLAVPETVKDFQALLDDLGSINRSKLYLNEIAADGHFYTENGFSGLLPNSPFLQNAYTWTALHRYEEMSSGSQSILLQYSGLYSSILNMNIILAEVDKSKDQDKSELQQVKAQALFNRGRFFFELAQSFAQPYKIGNADSDLGLVLRLSTDVTEASIRSTVKQTYNQIIADLNAAKDVLPNTPLFLTRPSRTAVLGLLAKVYLSMGDYQNAFKYANDYLGIKPNLITYKNLSQSANFIGVNEEIAFLDFMSAPSSLTTLYFIDQTLYNSYDVNDLRKQVFFKPGANGYTFKGHYSNSASDIFIGVSTDEMYLIRAEGYARSGNFPAAMKDLNNLLRTRYSRNSDGSTKYIDQTAIGEVDALTKIFNERKKQLILRNTRWTDLRRLNQDPRFAVTLVRTIAGQTYTLEPNSPRYTFPFPVEIIQKSKMQQNPGW